MRRIKLMDGVEIEINDEISNEFDKLYSKTFLEWVIKRLDETPVKISKTLQEFQPDYNPTKRKREFKSWRKSEETKLLQYINKNGKKTSSFVEISNILGRTFEACRLRYNLLGRAGKRIIKRAGKNYKKWTKTEEEILKKEIHMRGESYGSFTATGKLLNRSASSCMNKYLKMKMNKSSVKQG